MGDAEFGCFSPFCMEEMIGGTFFKCLEYGIAVSYVVDLEGMQFPNI